jgi:MYXO-CTERM domain-containing protein
MFQLGAYEAFNLDGGGSSEMWTAADGYRNNVSGNNLGSGTRAIANHWGVFAGTAPERPDRPGHCETAAPCDTIPPLGAIVDDTSACFRTFGPPEYWRTEATTGEGGSLHWTNATAGDVPYNWAWWRLELEQAGRYDVQAKIDPVFGVFGDTRYLVRANGVDTELRLDQGAASGWVSLGEFELAAGGDQWVAVWDDSNATIGTDPHITADAIQLVRLDPPTTPGTDPTDTGAPDTDTGTAPTDPPTGTDPGDGAPPEAPDTGTGDLAGCSCATGASGGWLAVLGALGVARRRARRIRRTIDA